MKEETVVKFQESSDGLFGSKPLEDQNYYVEKATPNYRKTVVVLVYEDQFGQKYLDEGTLIALTESDVFTEYEYPDGFVLSVNNRSFPQRKDPIPDGFTSTTRKVPDFSQQYPYNSRLGLYEVTDEQLAILIEEFKERHPELEVKTEIHKVELKEINIEKNDLKYNELSKMLNDDKDFNEIIDKNNNIKK